METFKKMIEKVDKQCYDYVIGGGDWNFTDVDIDRKGGNYTIWHESSIKLDEINEKLDTIDIWC